MSGTVLGYGLRVGREQVHVTRVLRPAPGVRQIRLLCGGHTPKPETTPYVDVVETAVWEKRPVLWAERPSRASTEAEKARRAGDTRTLCPNCTHRLKETA